MLLALVYNAGFWRTVLSGRDPWAPATWMFAGTTFVLLVALHFVPLMLLGAARLLRPALVLGFLSAAAASFFSLRYGVIADTDMLRNALHTSSAEASEFLGWGLVTWMGVFGLLPAIVLGRARIRRTPWLRELLGQAGAIAVALGVSALAARHVYQDLASVARNHPQLRHEINPLGPLLSAGKAWWRDHHQQALAHAPAEPAWRALPATGTRKPLLLVLVVGETARAANFSLAGYGRPTNPELAREHLITFANVRACGTATEVSLPCMFSPYGRAHYDEDLIRTHDSALQVLAHAGLQVTWIDNQSGCKRVCEGLRYVEAKSDAAPALCASGECLDETLLSATSRLSKDVGMDQLLVLHELGNHGPAYHRRYPPAFERFRPACRSDELRDCSRDEIVNAYDNAILYTDHVLAELIRHLRSRQSERDVAMIYVSDHGESLGEHGLYLHGTPYIVAPEEQLRVPMFWWLPGETARNLRLDGACLARRAASSASHDHLYHTLMGLLRIRTPSYRPALDLTAPCRDEFDTYRSERAPARDG